MLVSGLFLSLSSETTDEFLQGFFPYNYIQIFNK